jgi:hypothetical protein
VSRRPNRGWQVLAIVSLVLGALGVIGGVVRLLDGDLTGLLGVAWAALFWYWIGMGAWRRA